MTNKLSADELIAHYNAKTTPQVKLSADQLLQHYKEKRIAETSAVGRGVAKGAANMTSLVTEGVPGVAKGLVNQTADYLGMSQPFDTKPNFDAYTQQTQDTELKYPSAAPSYTDITQAPTTLQAIDKAGSFIGESVGEAVPQIGASLMGGGLGGMAAKGAITALAKKGGKDLAKSEIKRLTEQGIFTGAFVPGVAQNVPESYFNLYAQGEDNAAAAVIAGGLKSGLDAYGPFQIAKKLIGVDAANVVGGKLLSRMGKEGVKAGLTEGVTETAQTAVDQLAENFLLDNQELFTPEKFDELVNSGLKGMFGGAFVGAGTAPFGKGEAFDPSFDYESLTPKEKAKIEKRFQEEVIGEAINPAPVNRNDDVNPMDDSNVTPTFVDDATIESMNAFGLQKESLSALDIKQVDDTNKIVDTVFNSETAVNPYTPIQNPTLTDATLTARADEIQNDTRLDKVFLPGDGEIVFGVPLNKNPTLRNPQGSIKVVDTTKLEEEVAARLPAKRGRKIKPKVGVPVNKARSKTSLPADLRNAKPRYKTAKLKFPSDVEKALYIITPNSKSKRDADYVRFLKEATGLDEPRLRQLSTELKNSIKQEANNNPDLEEYNVAPVSFDVENDEEGSLKRTITLPSHGNFRDDVLTPVVMMKDLERVSMTPQGEAWVESFIGQAKRLITEVAGPKVRMSHFESLRDPEGNPVAGVAGIREIWLAMGLKRLAGLDETALHESYHIIENNGLLSDAEIAIIDRDTPFLRKYFDADNYLRTQDFETFLSAPAGRAELRANAFGKWAKEQRDSANLPLSFKKVFNKIYNYLERLGKLIRGNGFNTVEDVFKDINDGGRQIEEFVEANSYISKMGRLQRLSEEIQDQHNADVDAANNESYKDIIKAARMDANKEDAAKKRVPVVSNVVAGYSRYLQSIRSFAKGNTFFAALYSAMYSRQQSSQQYLESYLLELGDFIQADKGTKHKLHELGKYLKDTRQKGKLDENGFLTYERDGKVVRLNDKTVSHQYMSLMRGYAKVLDDKMDIAKLTFFEAHGAKLQLRPDFTLQDLSNISSILDEETDATLLEAVNEMMEAFVAYNRMKKSDFVPAMRFGGWGIKVRDKTAEKGEDQAAFYTVESGNFKNYFDKFQLEEAITRIKEKYSDSSRYEVIDANGVVTDLNVNSVTPFMLTNNKMKNSMDPRFMNIELLSSLLVSKGVDQAQFNDLRNEIYSDITTKGFAKRFSESNNIDGYSEDWNRTMHAYMSGAAHYLASLKHQKELASLATQANKLHNANDRAKALSYLEYNNSPQEDQAMLRTFNFMWTMGGNLSTAALQLMTLPTMTLGVISQYHPNVISNQITIAKWFSIAVKDFLPESVYTAYTADGMAVSSYTDEAKLLDLEKKGKIPKGYGKFIAKASSSGFVRGAITEEAIGLRPFETRSYGGGVRAKLSTVGNMAGFPISIAEQATRFATLMATYDILMKNPKAVERAKKALANDKLFQFALKRHPDRTLIESIALYSVDEAHGVFGKVARPTAFRSYGGSLLFPFMTYPQQALELMVSMGSRGPEGRRGLYVTLTALFVISGLVGLPGGELLKELLEAVEKELTGSEEDFDLLLREKIYEMTGDQAFAKFVTQGAGRAYAGLDISRRVGLPIVGQELIMTLLGLRASQPSDLLGVSGSVMTGIADAWNEYNSGGEATTIAASLFPVAPANLFKAYNMTNNGVSTKRGNVLLTPEQVTSKEVLGRMLGFGTDRIATAREERYYSQLAETKYDVAVNRYKERAKKLATEMVRLRKKGDGEGAASLNKQLRDVTIEYRDFMLKNKQNPNMSAFSKSVNEAVRQRVVGGVIPKELRKSARQENKHIQEILGKDF